MEDNRTAPIIDLLAGGFCLLWAVIGWASFAGNAPLRDSLGQQADPGPALVPLIVLTILTCGGLFLCAKGLIRAHRSEGGPGLPSATAHILPIGFALSLGCLVLLMPLIGFLISGIAFCILWLSVLATHRPSLQNGITNILVASAIAGATYMIFAWLLRVPLPGWPS